MVLSSDYVSRYGINIRYPFEQTNFTPTVSIVICTYGRPESLNDTLISLSHQTFKQFEVILITEKGELSKLRDKGLRDSKAPIVSFIDDDVYCQSTWLQAIVEAFKEKDVVGVSGPTTITKAYQANRDCLKYEKLRKLQEWFFEVPDKPGVLSICGAPSMVSNFEWNKYNGEVQYLECCNMSVRKKESLDVGGFDYTFFKTSEWSEVDLALKLSRVGRLRYDDRIQLFHRPSKAGVYRHRLSTDHRWKNFMYFQKKWEGIFIKKCLKTYIYRAFIWTYLKIKEFRII